MNDINLGEYKNRTEEFIERASPSVISVLNRKAFSDRYFDGDKWCEFVFVLAHHKITEFEYELLSDKMEQICSAFPVLGHPENKMCIEIEVGVSPKGRVFMLVCNFVVDFDTVVDFWGSSFREEQNILRYLAPGILIE